MALLSYVPSQQIRVNGVPRRLLDWDATAGYVAYASTAQATLDIREGPVNEGDRIEIWAGYGGVLTPCFAGEVDDDGVDYWPNVLTVKCSGQLARTQKGTGHIDPSAQQAPDTPDGQATDYAAAYSSMTDGQIVVALLALYNITNVAIQDSGQIFGTIQPVRLGVNQAAWQLIQDLDEATGYKTFDGPDGIVHRLPVIGVPGANAGVTLTQGADLIKGTRSRSRRYVNNVVTIGGIANLEGTTGIPFTPTATERGASPYIRSDQVYNWTSTLLETASACDAVAARKLSELNRLREETSIELGRLRADIRPAATASVDAPALGYNATDRFWVMQVQHRSQGHKLETTLTVFHAYAVDGYNPHQPPVAVCTVNVESETLSDGTDLTLAFCDGTASYAPMGTIVSYLWSGSPVSPVATGPSGATASVQYTGGVPASATVTLTVLDDTGAAGATTVSVGTVAASGANTRDIWGAITTDLIYSPDGGKTWGNAGVAAVGCCAEANPAYQLAWTSGGDLYKVSLATSGVGSTAMSASATLTGKGITAAWISYDQNGHFTGRCYAAGSGGTVYLSVDDATTWTALGAVPALGADGVTQIQESPFARGDLTATASNRSWHSYDSGATWASTYAHPTTALEATRLASGFAQHWVGFAGTGVTGEASRVEEVEQLVSLDVTPASAKPINVTGLALGVYQDRLYMTTLDTTGAVGSAWVADAQFSGNFTSAGYPNATLGPPRHLTRDGFFPGLLYGAADKALFKSPDEFASVLLWKSLTSPQAGKMIGFGRIRPPFGATGALLVSVHPLNDTSAANSVILLLDVAGWHLQSHHPAGDVNGAWGGGGNGSPWTRPLLKFGAYHFTLLTSAGGITASFGAAQNLYRSADGGKTWTLLGPTGVKGLDIANDGTGYAVVNAGLNLAKTTDWGATWTTLGWQPSPAPDYNQFTLQAVAVSPTNSARVAVKWPGYNGAIWASTDGGATFPQHFGQGDGAALNNSSVLLALADGATALYEPIYDGHTFFTFSLAAPGTATAGAAGLTANVYWPAIWRQSNGELLAFEQFNAANAGLYRSQDGGATWAQIYGQPGAAFPSYNTYPGVTAGLLAADGAYYTCNTRWNVGVAPTGPDATVVQLPAGADPNSGWVDLTPSLISAFGVKYQAYTGGMCRP